MPSALRPSGLKFIKERNGLMKKKILINGMSCENCVRHVTVALKDLDGVNEVEVRLDEKMATIEAENVSDQEIIDAIEEVGYEVVEIEEL